MTRKTPARALKMALGVASFLWAGCGDRSVDDPTAAIALPRRICDEGAYRPWLSPSGRLLLFWRQEVESVTAQPKVERPRGVSDDDLEDDGDASADTPARKWVTKPWILDLGARTERRLDWDAQPAAWTTDAWAIAADGRRLPIEGEVAGDVREPVALLPRDRWRGTRSRDGRLAVYRTDEPHRVLVAEAGVAPRTLETNLGEWMGNNGEQYEFSPDGRRLAFGLGQSSNWVTGIADLATGQVRSIADHGLFGDDDRGPDGSDSRADVGHWDEAGQRFAFLIPRPSNDATGADVYVSNASGDEVIRVTSDGGTKANVALSPDGDRVAFFASTSPSSARVARGLRLRLLELSTGRIVDLPIPGATARASGLRWLPDGKSVLFAWAGHRDDWRREWDDDRDGGIYRVPVPPPAAKVPHGPIVAASPAEIDDVAASLASDDDDETEWAVRQLWRISDRRLVGPVRRLIHRWSTSGGSHEWFYPVSFLEDQHAVEASPELIELVDPDRGGSPFYAPDAIELLMTWGIDAAVPALRRASRVTDDPDRTERRRMWALAALARFGDEDAWTGLTQAAGLQNVHSLTALATALAHVRDPRSVDLLLVLLTTDTYDPERLRGAVEWALWKLTGEQRGRDPAAWRDWWFGRRRELPPPGASKPR